MKMSMKVTIFAMVVVMNAILHPMAARADIFTGTNNPGESKDFSFTIASGESALRLTVPKSATTGSYILLKYETPLTGDSDYQYYSRIDNADNILDLDPPALKDGTWYVRILTPATASGPHTFTLIKDTGAAARPVTKTDAFVNYSADLESNADIYYRIDPTQPVNGWRIVLSGDASSKIELRAGYPTDGDIISASYNQTLHTLLVSPEQLTGATPYYIHIHADSPLTYSLTSDPAYFHDLSWDPGTSLAGTNVVSQPDSAGGDYLFRVAAQAPLHPAWRTVLNVTGGEADIYLQKDSPPLEGEWYSSTNAGSDAIYVGADQSLAGQTWYIRVHSTPGATWQLLSGDLFVQDLTWDDGSVPGGTDAIVQPATMAGEYFFRITSRTPANGAWRTVLNVTGGEADFYFQQNTPSLGDTTYKSTRTGSDGLILDNSQFGGNQSWYIRVHAAANATWNIFSGDIYVQDLGALADAGSNIAATIGPEGVYYFKTSVDTDTLAWRIWLNGLDLPLYIRKSTAPVKSPWTEVAEQYETGQMLLVPPYLTNSVYFIAVNGDPGTSFTLDSRKQPIFVPSSLAGFTSDEAGKEAFAFTLAGQGNIGGYGYITYRIDVPLEQIAWQVNVTPGAPEQNPDFYIRKGNVPNQWNNEGLSEAPAGVVDSITQVPPSLTNGAWYVTVYGTGTFSFSLKSGNPVIAPAYYINTPDPQLPAGYAFPYSTSALQNGLQYENQSGWRYYQVSDINSQLGFLGWQLDLAGQKPDSEIALRRNAVPARWRYRNGGSAYNTYVSNAYHIDASSTLGFLQHPNHQADIWYIGIYTPDEALGPFTLTTRDIPAPSKPLTGNFTVTNQYATVWEWVRFTVPSKDNPNSAAYEPNILGWDLRLKVTSGKAGLVVRRDQLPADLTTNMYSQSEWPSGWQWSQPIAGDWSGRLDGDGNSYLIMGMGSPLEAGTYYVGVSGDGSNSEPLIYTLESRAIGIGSDSQGNPWPIQVKDISFSGDGSVRSGADLQPREVDYYRVVVPEGTKGWSVRLEPTVGEAMLAIRHGRLPNNVYLNSANLAGWFWSPTADDASNFQGTRRQKNGREYFYKFPQDVWPSQTVITAGTYYIAVISEGQNPPSNTTTGTGGVSYTLTSDGEMFIADRTAAPISEVNPAAWVGETLHYGENRFYRVRAADGLRAIEIRLKNRVGEPGMSVRQDTAGDGHIPGYWNSYYGPRPNFPYAASEGGLLDGWQHNEIVTIANPSGDYTIMVGANQVNGADADASYDLEVAAVTYTPLGFANDAKSVTDQAANNWRYFKVEVPQAGSAPDYILGWDLRLKVTSGKALMVVRRDALPESFETCGPNGCPYVQSDWPSGWQWGTAMGGDWTGRLDGDGNSYLIMGMGSPLEAGTYYVGVSGDGSNSEPLIYTLESRAIGIGSDSQGNPWPIQVKDISFSGDGSVRSGADLQPREVDYYRVVVPEGTKGWSVRLEPTVGEAMLAIRHGRLPNNVYLNSANLAGWFWSPTADDASNFQGTRRQKNGREYFYKFPQDVWPSQTVITAGTYYIAVISEGQNPPSNTTTGTGGVSYTLTSDGEMFIADRTAAPISEVNPAAWVGETLHYGENRFYRVRAADGLRAIEIRLKNRVGEPGMSVRQDTAGDGHIPGYWNSYYGPRPNFPYAASEGGLLDGWQHNEIVTIANPSGDYTIMVGANQVNGADADASYDLEVAAVTYTPLGFANDAKSVTDQAANNWRYFKVEVPQAGSAPDYILGWDLRLKVTSGKALMVVRRDALPESFETCGPNGCPYVQSDWPSGWQWGTAMGGDWTGRLDGDGNSYLIMGMGSPLEAGTYYVGVSGDGSNSEPLIYTLESRAIGIGSDSQGNPWPIQVKDISFSGDGSVRSGADLQPREVDYYRVVVPEGTKGWSVRLEPTVGEAMLAIRHGRLPNNVYLNSANLAGWFWSPTADDASNFQGTRRQKNGREYFYKFPQDVWPSQTVITAGTYYIAVISEGQNPPSNTTTGTGGVSYTLTSDGEMFIADRTAAPISEVNPAAWVGETLHYGENRFYRVRAADGLRAIEIRLKNRVGEPGMSVRQDTAGDGHIPGYWNSYYGPRPNFPYAASEGGLLDGWQHNEIVTIANPSGDYTIMVGANQVNGADADASYDLEVRFISPLPLDLTGANATASGLLINQQVTYYHVTVPDTYNGYPIVGWKLRQETTSGTTAIRIRKDGIPTGNYDDFSSSNRFSVITPPILTPGEWFIEVRATGLSNYTITSDIISSDPLQHRRTWAMPAKTGMIESCSDTTAKVLIDAPYIGDSGITAPAASGGSCAEIINPTTGDLGADLADGDWHFYRVTVPDGNTGLLRTVVEALSGKPELYLRRGHAPTVDQYFYNEDGRYTPLAHRIQSYSGTMYGSWVPLNSRLETQLTPGDWWLGVRASGTNVRYRLKVSAGDVVNDAGQRQDKDGYVQDLALDGDQKTGQTLAAGDMRYYKLNMPASDLNQANSTPLNWNINLNQQVGDVLVFIRDTIPPGRGTDGNTTDPNTFQDWSDDTNSLAPLTTTFIDVPGNYTLSLPPVEPGKTYFLGVYAKSDAAFDIASTIGSERLKLAGILDFYGGSVNRTLEVGEQAVYRIDVPADAMRWRHTAQHTSEVKLYLLQDSVPRGNPQVDHWASCDWYGNNCVTDSSFSKYLYETANLNNYPWQSGHSYYLLVVNTSTSAQPFSLTMDGRNLVTDDEDQNGIPDWWEWKYFGGLWYGAESDPDGDGLSNLREYQLATDPTKPELLKTTIISPVDGASLVGTPLAVTGTAEIGVYGAISLVEVSLDGWSWTPATDTSANGSWAAWSFLFTPNGTDWRYTILSRATASTGNQERVPPTVTVTDSRFFFLNAEVSPANAGSIFQPGGPYFDGSIVNISANPAQCYQFTGWSGDAGGNDNQLDVTMDRAKSVTAHFTAKGPQSLSVNVNLPAGGAVNRQSGDITCGQTVHLMATPAAGYTFTGWSGDVTSVINPLDITINQPLTLTANFKLMKPGDIVTVAGNGAYQYDGNGGLALHAGIGNPIGVATDTAGNLYITEGWNWHVVRKVSPNGTIGTIAGTGSAGYSGDGGPAASAQLNQPQGIAVDAAGAVYVADTGNNVIRKISADGTSITTIAGTGSAGYSGDGGPAASALLNQPQGIAVDTSGAVYIADMGNNVIRKISTDGSSITTIAGTGAAGYSGDGGPATEAEMNAPYGVAIDKADRLFISDYNNNVVRMVDTYGTIITYSGSGTAGYSGDGGPSTAATLASPVGLAIDGADNLYVTDRDYYRVVRKIDKNGIITTLAGRGGYGYYGDGGPAASAYLAYPCGIAIDTSGNLYIADTYNDRVRMVVGPGSIAINGNAETTNGPDVTLTLWASDKDGVDKMRFSNDGTTWTDPEPYASIKQWSLANGFGMKTAYFQFNDLLGNWSPSISASINDTKDLIAPTSTVTQPNDGALLSGNLYTITGTVYDVGNGPYKVEVSLNGGVNWQDVGYYWYGGTTWNYNWYLPADGKYTVLSRATDAAGNTETTGTGVMVTVDNTPPTTTASPAGGLYNKVQSVTLTTDETAVIYYTTDGFTPSETSPVYSGPISVPSTATMTLKFFARDAAGNLESVKTETYSFDTVGPSGTIAVNGGVLRTNNAVVTLTLSSTDPSGVTLMQFSTDGSIWSTPEAYSTTKVLTLPSGDSTKTVYVKFNDSLGTWSGPYTASIILDTAAPVTTASPVGGTYASSQSVTLSANEGATIYYTTDGSNPSETSPVYSGPISVPSTATMTLKFFARDAAGNLESVKTETYSFETTVSGDLDGSGQVDLTDAILAFQVTVGRLPAITPHLENDVNGDGKIGMAEVIFILQSLAGLRTE